MLPRYLYISVRSISLSLNVTVFVTLWNLSLPKTKSFVLVSLNIIKFLEQNVARPSSCFCMPSIVSDISNKSSAHSRWRTISSPRHTPTEHDRYSLRSAKYRLNKPELALPPWFTPDTSKTGWLIFPLHFTRKWVLLYKLRMVSIILPCIPYFINLWNNILRLITSKVLEKSTKQTIKESPFRICLWISEFKMNILSAVMFPLTNPPLYSSCRPKSSHTSCRRSWKAISNILANIGRTVMPL